jgi:secreted trypsin-like serine protease
MMFTTNNQWILVGLTSYGAECADPLYSGVYTRVAAFQNWIESYTNESNWIDMGLNPAVSHANTISTSTSKLFFFIVLIVFVTFHY